MLLFEDIVRAEKIVSKHIITTPAVHSKALSEAVGEHIYLKLENQQITGSFKIRGAINAISNLSPAQKKAIIKTKMSWNKTINHRIARNAFI